jgi:O-antigen/teichoic acid export membrane protein
MTAGALPPSAVSAVPRNTAWLFVGRVLAQALGVASTVLLAARLGVAGLGQYAFVAAIVLLANVATTFGTDMVLIREIAGERRLDRWGPALAVQLALSVLAIVLICGAAPIIPGQGPEVVDALRILSFSLLPGALFSVCTSVLRGVGMMAAYAGIGVAAATVQLVAVAAFVPAGAGVVRTAAVVLGAQTVVAIGVWAVTAGRVPQLCQPPVVTRAAIRDMGRASAAVGVLGLLGILYQRLGAIAVAVMVGPVATGWYSAAARVVDASKTGHLALFGAAYPAMAEARGAGTVASAAMGEAAGAAPTRPRSRLEWSWRACLVLAAGVTIALLLLGPRLIEWFFGAAFAPSQSALAILACTVIPSTTATYQSMVLVAAHRDGDTLRVLGVSLTVLVALLVTLVPTIGWLGACWAMLGADTAHAGLLLVTRFAPPRRERDTASIVAGRVFSGPVQ